MCPTMGFSVKVVPEQAQKLETCIFCVFLPFEVICRPAPTRISVIDFFSTFFRIFFSEWTENVFVY
jgi:hypothetical protein